MIGRRVLAACAVAALVYVAPAQADENSDLDLIPGSLPVAPVESAPATTSSGQGAFYIEDAATLWSERSGLVAPPPPGSPTYWQDRLSADARRSWNLPSNLTATLSDRFNLYTQNNISMPSRQEFRNDFREGYLTWQATAGNYLEAGRINLKEGVAAGFNPTDFFKTDAVVDATTADPSVLRAGRLGTLMLHGQAITDKGSFEIAAAPKLASPQPLPTGALPSLDPQFYRTNSQDRFLLSAGLNPVGGLVPQVLLYHEAGSTKLGADVSDTIGKSMVVYAEWAGGEQRSLIADAVAYGKETGTLPVLAPNLPPSDSAMRFRSDLSVGGSWTGLSNLTVNLEYHYHQAGFSRADWRNWFAIGSAQPAFTQADAELWYVRGYAAVEGEPVSQQEAFLRLDWTDAFIRHLEIAALAFVDLYDGSTRDQVSASYELSDDWTLSGLAGTTLGGKRTELGSLPQASTFLVSVDRYF